MNLWAWIGRLLGEDNVQAIERIEPSLAAPWAQSHSAPGWLLFGCLALVALSIYFYWKWQTRGSRKLRLVLAIARGALLSLLLLVLAEPILVLKLTSSPRPLLWVLLDGSDSMAIEDELPPSDRQRLERAVGIAADTAESAASAATRKARPRIDYVKALFARRDNNLFERLQDKFQLQTFLFDRPDGVRAVQGGQANERLDPRQIVQQLTTDGQVTALGAALADLHRRQSGSGLAGLVVISDFDQNSGPSPLAHAARLNVPLYTVGVGPKATVDLRVALQSDPKMKKAERKTIDVQVHQEGLNGRSIAVKLTAIARSATSAQAEPILIGEKQLQLDQPTHVAQFDFIPQEAGRFTLVAQVEAQPGEAIGENNQAQREVTILDDFLRLMYVEYEPTWEWRFIKEVFHRDKLVGTRGFRTFLRSADPAVRHSNELFLPTMTPKRSDFFANDVIFLGDMPAATLGTRFCEMTKEFVSKFGGGLVVLAGPRFGPGELADTPLADMLPVVVDPDARLRDEREFNLQLAPGAAQVDFMRLGETHEENQRAWQNLGQLPWYQPVSRLHPLATALAEHPTDTCVDGRSRQPLVAIRSYGRGEVVYVGFNETWRLRRKYGELYYRQFWGQMIHRLGLSHALGNQKRFVVQTDRLQYQADDKVAVTVEAYDADFEPLKSEELPDRQLVAELVRPGRKADGSERTEPVRISQRREGVFEAQLRVDEGGEHRVRVTDPITGEPQEVHFQVTSLSAERRSAVRNVSLQQTLAQQTQGKSYELETVYQLVDDVQAPQRVETSVRVFALWNTWLVFGLVLALMFGEWLVRKIVSLP
jgi:hypothetical protein